MTGKSCGECGMCCKLLGIESIAKPPGQWCGHYRRGAGCSVYADRPAACSRFICLWLSSEGLDDAWRLDWITPGGGVQTTLAFDPEAGA